MRMHFCVLATLSAVKLAAASYHSPPQTIARWVALGDSFSAGPGSGSPASQDEGQCFRRNGAYPPLLQSSDLFQEGFLDPDFVFESCTGNTIPKVTDRQLQSIFPNTSIATVSIGGNDVLFYNILVACILNPWGRGGDCDKAIQNSTDIMYSGRMWSDWLNMTASISDRLHYSSRDANSVVPRHTAVYQTAYPPFFESWTGQCNEARFLPPYFPYAGPFITVETRDRLNILGQELNAVIALWIDELNYSLDAGRNASSVSFMRFANQDERYNGHRFCREGVVEPDRDNNQTWFFNLFSSGDSDKNLSRQAPREPSLASLPENITPCDLLSEPHTAAALACVASSVNASAPYNETSWPSDSEYIQKTFHPHHAGFQATSEELQQGLRYDVNNTATIGPGHLRIMCIGDSVAIGIGQDARENSYRFALNDLLANSNGQVEFVGSQRRGSAPSNHIEGYLAARISDLHHRLGESHIIASSQPNIVILTAGTADLRGLDGNDYAGLNNTRNELESLIGYIFTECKNCVVLVGDLPPFGKFQWPPSQRQKQIIQFNAMISEVVNKQQSIHIPIGANQTRRHVLKVHNTAAGGDVYKDNGYPNNNGYLKMAYDIHERLADAHTYGWILEPVEIGSQSGNRATNPGLVVGTLLEPQQAVLGL